jgi:hypothetical protein
MNKLHYAMGVSTKYDHRYKYLKQHKGTGIKKMLSESEMAQQDQRGYGAKPRHALKFKM